MSKNITKYFFIFLTIFLISCSLEWDKLTDPNLPYWVTHIEIPLTTSIISIDDMMSDIEDPSISKIIYSEVTNGDSTLYAFQDTIVEDLEPISLDDTGIKSFNDAITSQLGPIELSPIPKTVTPPFKLGEINPSLNSLNGQSGSIPGFQIQTIEKAFNFDDFQEATFKNGSLIIEIDNQLKIDLNDIYIKLKKTDGTYIDSTLISQVSAGNSKNGTIDLKDKTLPQNILIEVDGYSPGSTPNQIIINTDDYFLVNISGDNLTVSAAIAIIPSQSNPIEGNGNITLPQSDNLVAEAVFDIGFLKIVINNELDLDSELKMIIPNIQDASYNSDTLIITLPRNTLVDTVSDLKEKKMVIYSGDNFEEFLASIQEVSYSYKIDLESPSDFRTVSESDKIDVLFYFYGDTSTEDSLIQFSKIKGRIEERKETIGPITQSPPSLPPEMDDFLLRDEYVEMALYLKTSSNGIPIRLYMDIEATSGDSLLLTSSIIDWDISKQGPTIPIPGAADIINRSPESIIVTGSAVVGNNTDFTTISIVKTISMQSNFIINIPFVFQLKSGSYREEKPELITPESFDALPVDIEDIKTMRLFIDYDNQMGFGADINVLAAPDTTYFDDSSSVKPDTLVRSLFLENKTESKDSLTLNSQQMELFKDSIYIKTNVNMFGDEIFFLSTDSLILKVSASMEYLINNPDSTGIPDE